MCRKGCKKCHGNTITIALKKGYTLVDLDKAVGLEMLAKILGPVVVRWRHHKTSDGEKKCKPFFMLIRNIRLSICVAAWVKWGRHVMFYGSFPLPKDNAKKLGDEGFLFLNM